MKHYFNNFNARIFNICTICPEIRYVRCTIVDELKKQKPIEKSNNARLMR